MKSRATIKDVAALAGVSTATVSRSVTTPDCVRLATRRRVNEAIRVLNYQPDAVARALSSGRSRIVGTVIPTLNNASFAQQTQSLQSTLAEAGYQLIVAGHEHDPQTELRQIRALQRQGVDALVIVGTTHSTAFWRSLRDWGKPALLTWTADSRLPSIAVDNVEAARTATQHLIDFGHERIGMIAGITRHNERARQRVAGARQALTRAGLSLPQARFTEQPFGFDGGAQGLRLLLAQGGSPTAIFCGNDLLAAGALLEAQRLGVQVPNQLSICGFDDMDLAKAINPGLTTVHVPVQELGKLAGHGILEMLAGGTIAQRTMLTVTLVERGSTGPVNFQP